jgi:hypothetical protein
MREDCTESLKGTAGPDQFAQAEWPPCPAAAMAHESVSAMGVRYPMLHGEATVISEQRGPKLAVEHCQHRLERSDCLSQMSPDLFDGGIGGADHLTKYIAQTLPSTREVSQGSLQSTRLAHPGRDAFEPQALIEIIFQFLHAAAAIGHHSDRKHRAGNSATRAAETFN